MDASTVDASTAGSIEKERNKSDEASGRDDLS